MQQEKKSGRRVTVKTIVTTLMVLFLFVSHILNAQQIDLSQAVKNFVLRILQEFLQNSLKHAACTEIKVSMQNEETGLTVSSFDNGQGFTMNGKQYAGIGLQNIRKRAEIIGADLRIDSTPGEGTRMRLFIPSQKLNA